MLHPIFDQLKIMLKLSRNSFMREGTWEKMCSLLHASTDDVRHENVNILKP